MVQQSFLHVVTYMYNIYNYSFSSYRPIQFQERYIALSAMPGGASESMTKDEYFKLCPTLVQEQAYAWVITSSFVCSWKPPRYGGRHLLETELVYRQMISYKTSFVNAWYVRMTNPLIRTWLLLLNVIRNVIRIVISPTLTNAHFTHHNSKHE